MLRTLYPLFCLTLLPLAQPTCDTAPSAHDVPLTTLREDDTQPVLVAEPGGDYAVAIGGYLTAQRGVLEGDAAAALQGFLNALSEDSSNIGLQQDAFAAALLKGDVDTAVRLGRVLPAHTEADTMVWMVRLADAARQGNTDEALKLALKLERSVPELLQFKLLRAYAEREQGMATETVLKQLGPVTGIPAQQARQWYHMGRMRAQTGDVKGGITALEQAYTLEPASLFTVALLTRLYEMDGQAEKATEVLERFRLENPQMTLLGMMGGTTAPNAMTEDFADDISEVLFDFGILVWAQGADMTARQIFNLALWLSPDATYVLYYSAMMEEFAGGYATAEAKYGQLLDNPEVGDAVRLRLAELMFKQGRDKEAAKAVEAILRVHPDDIGALRARAEIAFETQDFKEAAKRYGQVINLMPEGTDAQTMAGLWFALGACYERMGRIDKAEEALKTSLVYVSDNPSVLNYLGYTWVEHNRNLDEAFLLLNAALALAPTDGAIMDSVGWAHFMRGDTEQALMFLEQAAELAPDDPVAVDHLGDAYLKLGRPAEAVWQWERALVLAKDNPDEHAELLHDAARKIRRYQ